MNYENITVAITGMNARPDNPGPGVAVARCLRESPRFSGKIIGLGYDNLDPGLYLNEYCDNSYLLPYPSAGDDAIISRLRHIQETENIDILIPCLDAEMPSFSRLSPLLEDMGFKTFLPTTEQLRLRNKDRLHEIASMANVSCPEIICVTSADFFNDCEDKGWTFPMVVKGLFYDAQIVYDAKEGRDTLNRIAADWGFPILVQRMVEGQEYNLTAVGDGKGNMLGPVMMKKMAVTDKGKAWAGVSINDQKLLDASTAIIEKLKWRGPLEIEVMRDKNGEYQLIEINPRFPAWLYLSVGVNYDLLATLIDLITNNEPMPFCKPLTGILFIRHAADQIISIAEYESIVTNGKNDFGNRARTVGTG